MHYIIITFFVSNIKLGLLLEGFFIYFNNN